MEAQTILNVASSVAFSGTLLLVPIGGLVSASLFLAATGHFVFSAGVAGALYLSVLYLYFASCMGWHYVWIISGWDGIDRAVTLGLSSIGLATRGISCTSSPSDSFYRKTHPDLSRPVGLLSPPRSGFYI